MPTFKSRFTFQMSSPSPPVLCILLKFKKWLLGDPVDHFHETTLETLNPEIIKRLGKNNKKHVSKTESPPSLLALTFKTNVAEHLYSQIARLLFFVAEVCALMLCVNAMNI